MPHPLLFLQNVMEDLVLFSLDHDPLSSPPRTLLPLMLTCRRFYHLLRPSDNPQLYHRIFYRKFDSAAIARRLPPSCIVSSHFYAELKKRFLALRCIKLGDVHHPQLEDAFLVAYIMLLEHDALNRRHLVDVGLPALLDKYIAERLHRGLNVWPIEDTCNVLAVALFWHMTSQDALNGESIDSRNKVVDALLPFSFAWFRYSFLEQGFDPYVFVNATTFTPRQTPPTHTHVHPPPMTVPIDYMGHAFDLRLPAIALSATLSFYVRLGAIPLVFLPFPREPGVGEWTLEEVDEYNDSFRTRTVPRDPGSLDSSTCYDWDWLRAVAGDPFMSEPLRRYTPGVLTGKWRGTEMAPYETDLIRFMTGAGPANFTGQSRLPLSFCLEEHVRYSNPQSCASGDEWDDPRHVPLSPPTSWTRKEDGIELFDERSSTKVFYKTLNRESSGEEPENVQDDSELGTTTTRANQEIVDVILSGRAEHDIYAWDIWGRVRISDGLVVIVRIPSASPQGRRLPRRSIYVGYLMSSQNLVGKWKYCTPGGQWDGTWGLCKAVERK